MFAINWMGSFKYKPYVVCIELNPFKYESGSVREFPPSSWEQSQVDKLSPKKPKPQKGYIRMPHQAPLWLFLL